MAMSTRAKRRLAALLVAVAIGCAAVSGLIVARSAYRARQAEEWHARGVALFEQDRFEDALPFLGRYIMRAAESDPRLSDALLMYANAQRRVPLENRRHIHSAAARASRAAQLDPEALPPRELLLELYPSLGFYTETLDVVNEVLEIDPDHEFALRTRVEALAVLGKRREALSAAHAYAGAHPGSLRPRNLVVSLMVSLGEPTQAVLEYTERVLEEMPDNAGAALLCARMFASVGDDTGAAAMLERARAMPIRDAATLQDFIRVIDLLRMRAAQLPNGDHAVQEPDRMINDLLATARTDPALAGIADIISIERHWKLGRRNEAQTHAATLVRDLSEASDEAVGWAALLALEQDPTSFADSPISTEIAARSTDEAQAWNSTITGRSAMLRNDAADALEHFSDAGAVAMFSAPELIAFWTAEVSNSIGEHRRAVDLYADTLLIDPTWEHARVALAAAHLAHGNVREAFEAVSVLEQPATVEGYYIVARVIAAALEADLPGVNERTGIAPLRDLANRLPESGDFAALLARGLLAAGRAEEAQAEIDRILSANLPANTAELRVLADAMERSGLAGAEHVLARIRDRAPFSPDIRLMMALEAADAGRAGEGEAMLRQAAADSTTDSERYANQRVLALYLDATGAPAALATLRDLADANPRSVVAQRDLLDSRAAWTSEENINASIARLREITGDGGGAWRIYEARRLLTFQASEANAADALNILAPLIRREPAEPAALVLSAEANLILDDRAGAIDSLSRAMDTAPDRPGVAPRLIGLLQQAGRNGEAERRLRDYLELPNLTLAERRRRAELLIHQGLWGAALPELEAIAQEGTARDNVVFAAALTRQGQPDRATEVFESVLQDADVEADAVLAAADFFASRRRMDRAEAALVRLPDSLSETERRLLEAAFRARHGQHDRATEILNDLAQSAPSPQVWLERIRHAQARGNPETALSLLAEATTRWPDDPSVQAMLRVQRVSNLAGLSGQEISELAASVAAPGERPAAEAVLAALQTIQSNGAVSDQALAQLRGVTTDWPTYYPGWRALVNTLLSTGEVHHANEAVQSVRTAVDLIPTSPQVAQLAYEVFRVAGRLDEAAGAARQWRDRSIGAPFDADVAIANVESARERYADALAALEPWTDRIVHDVDRNPGVFELLAALLARNGRVDEAHALLWERARASDAAALAFVRVTQAIDSASSQPDAWLEEIEPEIEAPPARILLAQAWFELGSRTGSADRMRRAIPILEGMASGPTLAAEALTLLALVHESLDDPAEAERAYRRAIELSPRFGVALNNLAYLIVTTGGDAQEAVGLAQRANQAIPSDATPDQRAGYLDTLAAALRLTGQVNASIDTFRQAIFIAPAHASAHIGLAEALLDAGDPGAASDPLQTAQRLLNVAPDPGLTERLNAALARLTELSGAAR